MTLGASVPESYDIQTSILSVGDTNTTFLTSLAFGTVYQTDGVDSSDYFVDFNTTGAEIQFNTNV